MTREVKIFLFSIYFENKLAPILGISITDTYENAIDELEKYFQNIDRFVFIDVICWDEFKNSYVYEDWPELYRSNESGIFSESEFYDACQFVLSVLSSTLQTTEKPSIFNINLN